MGLGLGLVSLGAATPASGAERVRVYVYNFEYGIHQPDLGLPEQDPVIRVGDTVEWFWWSGFHGVVSLAGQPEVFASVLQQGFGLTFSHTFTRPGDYVYYCSIHTFLGGPEPIGMIGKVTVIPSPTGAGLLTVAAMGAGARRRRRDA